MLITTELDDEKARLDMEAEKLPYEEGTIFGLGMGSERFALSQN
jgi:hypothetical protein